MKVKKWSSQWTQFMQLRKEAWKKKKKSGPQRGLNPWPRDYRCDALPTELWSHRRWEQVNCGFICTGNREVTGSNPVEVLNFFFQASLRNCINCVHCDDHFFIFISFSAVHIWFISYIINTCFYLLLLTLTSFWWIKHNNNDDDDDDDDDDYY